MSGELKLKYPETGKTILALILSPDARSRWNGEMFVNISNITDANWTAGMVALTEQATYNGTKTRTYVGNFPAGITVAGEYTVEYYLSTSATPGSQAIGSQDVWWNGTKTVAPSEILDVNLTNINGTSVKDDGHGNLFPPSFDFVLARSGSSRTLLQVKGGNPYAAWEVDSLKGCLLFDAGFFPAVILSNTAITASSGTITLAGNGLSVAPLANDRLSLGINSHSDVLTVKAKTDSLPASPAAVGSQMDLVNSPNAAALTAIGSQVWAATVRSLTTFGALSGDVAAVKSKTDNLPVNPAAVGSAMTLTSAYDAAKTAAPPGAAMTLTTAERQAVAAALLDLANAVDGKTLRQTLQIVAAVVAGKVSGAGSSTETFRGLNDQNNRVVVTADPLGNRTNVTYP
jgi:hypothetical protein